MKNTLIAILVICLLLAAVGAIVYFLGNLPTHITALVGGAIGFLVSRIYESYQAYKARLYEKKREVYNNLIAPWQNILVKTITQENDEKESSTSEEEKENLISKKEKEQAVRAAFDAILYASDEVIKEYGKFRNIAINAAKNDPMEALSGLANLYRVMRSDLGHYTSLSDYEILRLFINLDSKEFAEYRSRLK